jgi:hypothetical protein
MVPIRILLISQALQAAVQAIEPIRLIIRGDTQGSLVAFQRAFNEGAFSSASVGVPGSWFQGAAERRFWRSSRALS